MLAFFFHLSPTKNILTCIFLKWLLVFSTFLVQKFIFDLLSFETLCSLSFCYYLINVWYSTAFGALKADFHLFDRQTYIFLATYKISNKWVTRPYWFRCSNFTFWKALFYAYWPLKVCFFLLYTKFPIFSIQKIALVGCRPVGQ
jgi:hypothetical protein